MSNIEPFIKIKLIISSGQFIERVILYYEKHFSRKGKNVIEYYYNNKVDTYFEITKKSRYRLTIGYGVNNEIFYKEIILFNNEGVATKEYQKIYNFDGTITEYVDVL